MIDFRRLIAVMTECFLRPNLKPIFGTPYNDNLTTYLHLTIPNSNDLTKLLRPPDGPLTATPSHSQVIWSVELLYFIYLVGPNQESRVILTQVPDCPHPPYIKVSS